MGDVEWPETKPPFAPTGAFVIGDEFWVRSYERSDGGHYHVFDSEGRLDRSVLFPTGYAPVGASDEFVYLLSRDELDMASLSRVEICRTTVEPSCMLMLETGE